MSVQREKKNDPCSCGSKRKYRQCCWLKRFDNDKPPLNCTCRPVTLYWIKDDVWTIAAPAAAKVAGGHLCPDCVARIIGRLLTLEDLAVANYLRTARNMVDGQRFMQEYVRATVIGGLQAAGLPIPSRWGMPTIQPHIDAIKVGEQLARQTRDPRAVLPALTAEVDRYFPK